MYLIFSRTHRGTSVYSLTQSIYWTKKHCSWKTCSEISLCIKFRHIDIFENVRAKIVLAELRALSVSTELLTQVEGAWQTQH